MGRRYKKRKYNKKGKKRYGKNKYKRNKINILTVKGPLSAPDKLMVKLKYTELFQMAGVTSQQHVFRGNSCFDPNSSGIGLQPNGFDEWSALYTRYRVHASKIKLMLVNNQAAGVLFSLQPSDSPSTSGNLSAASGNPYNVTKILGCAQGMDRTVINNYITTKAMRGENISQEDDYSAPTTANPARQWFWLMINNGTSGNDVDVSVFLEITYYTEFFRRKELLAS